MKYCKSHNLIMSRGFPYWVFVLGIHSHLSEMTLPLTFKTKFYFRFFFLHEAVILLGLSEEPNTFMKH